ncbi:MAG: guanylate kinase [Planctomycetes bacterium]|nr:guanylate kinase [Planctomycetota bacterium]
MNSSRTSNEGAPGRRIVVLSGPSAVGKTTVARHLVADPALERVVTVTTRPPRPREVDGRDYHFLDRAEFERRRAAGEFLEWAQVYGHFYATPRAAVDAILQRRMTPLLVLDIQGAEQIRDAGLDAVFIFLVAPDAETLEDRLAGRGTEGPGQRDRRLEEAAAEVARAAWFTHRIENRDLEETVRRVRAAIALR